MHKELRREMASEGFVTVTEAVKFSGIKKSKMYCLMDAGKLPYAKIGTSRRIPRKALIEFMADALIIRDEA